MLVFVTKEKGTRRYVSQGKNIPTNGVVLWSSPWGSEVSGNRKLCPNVPGITTRVLRHKK